MTSILKVDNLQDASGTGTPYITGAVLQVKYFQLTTSQIETYSSANADQAVSNFTVNITPKSSSSIIKLEAQLFHESANVPWSSMFFFFRDSTKLANTEPSPSSRNIGIASASISYQNEAATTPEMLHMTYFDSPNSTSAIAYKLGYRTASTNNLFINRTITDGTDNSHERGVSFISATEIGG